MSAAMPAVVPAATTSRPAPKECSLPTAGDMRRIKEVSLWMMIRRPPKVGPEDLFAER